MSFTLFSVVLLLAVGVAMFIEVLRGLKRGFTRTMLSLATVLLAALGAGWLAVWLSDTPAQTVGNALMELLNRAGNVTTLFPHLEALVFAAADALLSPLLFVVFFLILRLILRVLVSILCRSCLKKIPDAPSGGQVGDYAGTNAPWYRRHDRMLGGVAGGLCGFLASLMLLCPVLGVLSVGNRVLRSTEATHLRWSTLGINPADIEYGVKPYAYDSVAAVLNAMGGDLIFSAVARTELEGETVSLPREAEACCEIATDFFSVYKVLGHMGEATPEQRETLASLGEQIDDSLAVRVLATDVVNGAADAWLEGKTYLKIARPSCGELIDPLITKALQVCTQSTPDCVGRDITTLLHVVLIANDYGLLSNPDYKTLLEGLGEDSVLDKIYAELAANPCMAHLCDDLTALALRMMVSAIEWSDLSDAVYSGLLENLADSLNLVNGMNNSSREEKIQAMTEYATYYMAQQGVQVPAGLAEMAAAQMVDQFGDGQVTGTDLKDFFDRYLDDH